MTQWGLDTLFNPAKRHMDEEKRRLQSTREQIGDNSGGRRIDLESGKVVIRRADDEADEQPEAVSARSRRRHKKTDGKTEDAPATADTPAPSAAAIRAAERRKRRSR